MNVETSNVDGDIVESHRPLTHDFAQLRYPVYRGKVSEVVMKGGEPWGFTVSGGLEMNAPLVISKIELGSKAEEQGLGVGDIVLEVNDVQCASETEAIQLIQSAFNTLTLTIQRGSTDIETSPKSSEFLRRVQELREKEQENRAMLSSQQPTIVGGRVGGFGASGVKMRLKRNDQPQEPYRPKSWHHSHEGHKQNQEAARNQNHEEEYRRRYQPPENHSSRTHWQDRDITPAQSVTSLISFRGQQQQQQQQQQPSSSQRGFVKLRTHAYDDMTQKATTNTYQYTPRDNDFRITHSAFEQERKPEYYGQIHSRDFEKNNRNDFHEPNREQKWKKDYHVKPQTFRDHDWTKKEDSFVHRVDRNREMKAIPVQLVHAQPLTAEVQPVQKQYRVEVNIDSQKQSPSVSDVKSPPTTNFGQSQDIIRRNSGPHETIKRSSLTYMISPTSSQSKIQEPQFTYEQYSPPEKQEYKSPPPPISPTRREMSPPIPPQRDSSMKIRLHSHDKSPSWPVSAEGSKTFISERDVHPTHVHAHTWTPSTYPQVTPSKSAEHVNTDLQPFQGYKGQVRTLPDSAKQPHTQTFASQVHLEKEPQTGKTAYHPVYQSESGGYFIDGKHYKYPPSSKFEVHTATVYLVEMDEPLKAEVLEKPMEVEPKFTKPYDYTQKYNVPSPPTRDVPLERQELNPEMVNANRPTPVGSRDTSPDKFSPERFQSPSSLNSTMKSAGSAEDMIKKYESLLERNLVEQGYESHSQSLKGTLNQEVMVRPQSVEPEKTTSVPLQPKAEHSYTRRSSRDRPRNLENIVTNSPNMQEPIVSGREQELVNGYKEDHKQGRPRHPDGKGEAGVDVWRQDITHLDDEKASSLKRWWKSPGDYQITPGMGTGVSKRHAISPTEETVKRFENTLNVQGSAKDIGLSETDLSNDSKEELSKKTSYPKLADAQKQSTFTKLKEQHTPKLSTSKPSIFEIEEDNPFRREFQYQQYDASVQEQGKVESKYPVVMSPTLRDSQTQFSDKYKHGEPIALQKKKEKERSKDDSLSRQNLKSPASPTGTNTSILSNLQKEQAGYASIKNLSSKVKNKEEFLKESKEPELPTVHKAKREAFFSNLSPSQDERLPAPDVIPHNVSQGSSKDTSPPHTEATYKQFDEEHSKSASMFVRSPSAEVNKWYDHVKGDDSRHSRSMSYAYDPTSPSRTYQGGMEKPLSDIDEEWSHGNRRNSRRQSSDPKRRTSDPRRSSDPRRTSDPRRISDPKRRESDPKTLSDPEKMFQRSVGIEGVRRNEDAQRPKLANHDRQYRTSDPYREEYGSKQNISDPKKERQHSDAKKEHKKSDPKMERIADHRHSKSDSEKYHKTSASEQWRKRSDPTSRNKKRQPSDPEEKRKMREALLSFYSSKTGCYAHGPGPLSAHPRLETAESLSSLASSTKQTGYVDRSKVEVAIMRSEPPKRSYSTSSFRRDSDTSGQSLPRTRSEVVRPNSLPPNNYSQNDIKNQTSYGSFASQRDSMSSASSHRDRPSSGGSPTSSLAGSKHKSPHQSQESILGKAQRRHHRLQSDSQSAKLPANTSSYVDKTASLPAAGRTGRGPPVKVSSTQAILKLYSNNSFKDRAISPQFQKTEPSAMRQASTSTPNQPLSGNKEKAATLPMSFRNADQNTNDATSSVQHGAVLVTLVNSESNSDDDEREETREAQLTRQESIKAYNRHADPKIFKFPPSQTLEDTQPPPLPKSPEEIDTSCSETSSDESDTETTEKDLLSATDQLYTVKNQQTISPSARRLREKRSIEFRYKTTDSFILPSPPGSPSVDELDSQDESEFPPPPHIGSIEELEPTEDTMLQTQPVADHKTPLRDNSTNFLKKIEKEITMHPQTTLIHTEKETYREYMEKRCPQRTGPFMNYNRPTPASSMSSLPTTPEKAESPLKSRSFTKLPVSSPSVEQNTTTSLTAITSMSSSSTVQSSMTVTLSKNKNPKSPFTSPLKDSWSPGKLKPAKSLDTVLTSPLKSPTKTAPGRPFSRIASFSSVKEIKNKFETKDEISEREEREAEKPVQASPIDVRTSPVNIRNSPVNIQISPVNTQTSPPVSIKEDTEPTPKKVDEVTTDHVDGVTKQPPKEEHKEKEEIKEKEPKKEKAKTAEEIKAEELAKAICHESNDRTLSNLLAPQQKTTEDFMSGIFPQNTCTSPPKRRKSSSRLLNGDIKPLEKKATPPKKEDPNVLRHYFETSVVKAQLLQNKDVEVEEITADSEELNQKKEELIESITKKLEGLREEQTQLQIEMAENEEFGKGVTEMAKSVCTGNEFSKYNLFVDELDKIINLLLALSGRLARAENALNNLEPDCDEELKTSLTEKRDKLKTQHEEAKKLKEGIDRRNGQVATCLRKHLNDEEYADFQHFVTLKSTHIMTLRQISDNIKLGEEQLLALQDSMQTDKLFKLV
ncbi:uncharacterized protein LOC144439390 [Glandiceps talaboti]